MKSLFLLLILLGSCFAKNLPDQNGLALWLDAGEEKTFSLNESGHVIKWRDRREESQGLEAHSSHPPQLVRDALGGRSVIRFSGDNSFKIAGALKGAKEATIFIVFSRPEEMKGKQKWQKVLTQGNDTKGVFLSTEKKVGALSTMVVRGSFHQLSGEDLYVGTGKDGVAGELWGDIAEVLVYRKTFYAEEPMAEIVSYLEKKWSFKEDRSSDWTHVGPLPEVAKRSNDRYPLTDQQNEGKWTPHQEMWDEFEPTKLDDQKWWDHNPTWYGRAPARYLTREVQIEEGELRLTMRKDPNLKVEQFYRGKTFKDYSSGTIKSKKATLYGYFEIEAQAMASAASSAWWFTGESRELKGRGRHRVEIDVFELGGRSKGREQTYSMNLHVFRSPESNRHWNRGGEWEAPFKFADGFHVFGLDWGPDLIRYYVDGALVRSVKNDAWHAPMYMLFDSETMIDWLGVPEDKDLPSTFRVTYVRAWKNARTQNEWWKKFRMSHGRFEKYSPITKYVRSMEVNAAGK